MLVNAFCFFCVAFFVVGGGGGCIFLIVVIIIYIYIYQLTLKDFLSIIGIINTCVPNFSLSLLLYTLLLFERFTLLLPLLIYCVSDSGLHLLFLVPLFLITLLV